MNKLDYSIGFKDFVQPEHTNITVSGQIPEWLNGIYLRNGSGKFTLGKQTVRHWFDGLSVINKFQFKKGEVTYHSVIQDTVEKRHADKTGKLRSLQFGTQVEQNFLQKLKGLFEPAILGDNTSVNIIPNGKEALCLTETPIITKINTDTLSNIGQITFPNKLNYQFTTAHPGYDPITKKIINLGINLGLKSFYNIFEMDVHSYERNLICSIPVKNPSYHHSFAICEQYIVLFDIPLRVNPLSMFFSSKGFGPAFIENYHWHPEQGTKIIIIDRQKKCVVNEIMTDSFMMFHTANCFLNNDELIVDAVIQDTPQSIQDLYLDKVVLGNSLTSSKLTRFQLNLKKNTCLTQTFDQFGCEFPRYNYSYTGHNYQYLYTASYNENSVFLNLLHKWDMITGVKQLWQEENCYVGEPIFVSKLNSLNEDEGVVLSIILDAKRKISFLLILDAKMWQEIARVELDHVLPYGFHGNFTFMNE